MIRVKSAMQCQIETLPSQSGQNSLMDNPDSVGVRDCTFAELDDEDLKGLREWVTAKRIWEARPEKIYRQIYSAPWRIG
jgi:hypothetical protein